MPQKERTLWTIGHTTHSFDVLTSLLKKHDVTAVADVRSQPYSRRLSQFNREQLFVGLTAAGIRYEFLGDQLGARRIEPESYAADRADYRLIAALPKFREGLEQLRRLAAEFHVALLCAEKEPLDCHRTILVCRQLRHEFHIVHILADGTTEDHAATEKRLVQQMDVFRSLFDPDLSDEQLVQQAYDKRAEQIAFRRSKEGVFQ